MDTEDSLKKNWKIKRDIEKRGYTKEKVLEQILKREKDYFKYIDIQKDKSDIIIKFFSNSKFDINKINEDIKTSLSIKVNKKFNLKSIISEFEKQNINYTLKNTDKFTELIFDDYIYFRFSDIQINNFYDYISFIILNLK
jgi:hypothetical protein